MLNTRSQIFVIAGPRSGTSWLSKALNAHPKLFCTERRLFGEYADLVDTTGSELPRLRITLDKFLSATLLHQELPKSYHDILTKKFIESLQQAEIEYSGKRILVDKITPYVGTSALVADRITEFFPRAKTIYLLRDGRDVATSGVFHWFNKKPSGIAETAHQKIRREMLINGNRSGALERFFQDDEVDEWARTWAEPLRTIPTMRVRRHPVLLLRYEDMIGDQGRVLSNVFEFCRIRTSAAILDKCIETSSFEAMTGGRRAGQEAPGAHVRKGVTGDWKNYFTQQDGEIFHALAGDMLKKHGYETDDNWYSLLPETLNISH